MAGNGVERGRPVDKHLTLIQLMLGGLQKRELLITRMLVSVIFWVWYMGFECRGVVQGKLVIIATKSKEGNICGIKRIALSIP